MKEGLQKVVMDKIQQSPNVPPLTHMWAVMERGWRWVLSWREDGGGCCHGERMEVDVVMERGEGGRCHGERMEVAVVMERNAIKQPPLPPLQKAFYPTATTPHSNHTIAITLQQPHTIATTP